MAKTTNLTKYDAGGTGDNIIPDGFIKTVEKVWVDTYVFSSASTIGTGLVIEIATIPQGKKVTGIEVYGLGAISTGSAGTVSIGATMVTLNVTNATLFLAATTLGTATFQNFPVMATSNIGVELTGGTNRIFLLFGTASPTVTGGTLTTKVRYT